MPAITAVEPGFYRIPLPQVLTDSTHGEMSAFELVTVRVRDSEGAEGVGYTYTVGRNGAAVHAVLAREIPEIVAGADADRIEALWHKLWWALHYGGRGGPTVLAISAFDMALWDLKARRANAPLWSLLGGFDPDVPVYAGGIDLDLPLDALLRQTDDNLAKGFRAIKMKVGRPRLHEDVARVAAMREHLGVGFPLMADANMKWGVDEAIRAARALAPHDLTWLEEPTIPDDPSGHARILREGGLPIAAGENLRSLWEFKAYIAAGAVTYPEPDVTNCGGVTPFMKIARLAEAFNLPVTSHGAHDVTVHLLAACPNRSYLEAHGFGLERYIAEPLAIADGKFPAMLGLGFSSGMPFLLVYITQSAWLSEARVPLATIGLMSELTIAYKLKFLWAPFLDRYDPPLFGRWLGRRRGWIVASQMAVALALAGVAFGDPEHRLTWTVVFSLALGVAGATQDVVIDGWRIAVTPKERQALMSSWSEVGFRIGNLAAGAGALYLADWFGWRAAYLCMALLMGPGMLAALLAPEPPSDLHRPDDRPSLVATVVTPIKDLVGRLGPMALPVLLLVAGFRMPGYVSSAMEMPLFKSLHYSDSDIATVTKLFGFWVALGGTFLAAAILPRIGMLAGLVVGTVFGSASHLSLAYLAAHGDHAGGEFWLFAAAVSLDSFAYAFASIVLITFMSQLATAENAASQYALLTSLCALPGSLLAGLSGFIIERTGFPLFFVLTSLIGLPVAGLALFVWRARRHEGYALGIAA